jgi:hypothetical protein
VALTGKVKLDAGYITAQGAGSLATQGDVISARLDLAALGSQLIGNNGAAVLAAVSAGIVSNNGSGIISDNGAGRRLLEDAQADGVLPVAGMAVQAINPATNQPVLMVDARGHVGKWVLSDAQGNYKLYVPRTLQGNVLIQAQPPAKLADARLRLSRLVKAGEQLDVAVDEATTLAVEFCRDTLRARLETLMTQAPGTDIRDSHLSAAELAALNALHQQLADAFAAAGTKDFTPHQRSALAYLIANELLGGLTLDEVRIDRTVGDYTGPDEPALMAMEAVLRTIQAGASAKLREDPSFFDQQPFLTRFNAWAATVGRKPFAVKTPADVGAFIGEAYIAGNDTVELYGEGGSPWASTRGVLELMGIRQARENMERLRAGVNGMSRAVTYSFAEHLDDVAALVRGMARPDARAELDAIDTEGR